MVVLHSGASTAYTHVHQQVRWTGKQTDKFGHTHTTHVKLRPHPHKTNRKTGRHTHTHTEEFGAVMAFLSYKAIPH